MRSITIRAEDALVDELDARSEADGTSRNAVAVAALQSYLQSKTPENDCKVGADAITDDCKDDCKVSADDCSVGAADAALVEALQAHVAQLTAANAELSAALRESMSATAAALDTAKAAQALQAASKPGLVERIRGLFGR